MTPEEMERYKMDSYEALRLRARNCEYAQIAVGTEENPINWGDAEAFYIEGWDAAVKETKKACVQAVGNVMMEPACHWSTIKDAIMQAEVK